MNIYNVKNLVISALVMHLLIVFGILGSGLAARDGGGYIVSGTQFNLSEFICEWGWWLLLLPTVWFGFTFWELNSEKPKVHRQVLWLITGSALVLSLLCVFYNSINLRILLRARGGLSE
jgi:hypothetical protein